MSVEWPLPETATAEEMQVASQSIVNSLPDLAANLEVADTDLAQVEAAYIARKAVKDIQQNNLDRALYKLEVLQARLNDIGG